MGPGGRRGTGSVMRTTMAVGRDVGSSGGGRLKKYFERLRFRCYVTCGRERGFRRWYKIHKNVGYTRYIHRLIDKYTITHICRLIDKYTTTYICRLIDECTRLYSSIEAIFLGSGTKEYIAVIFLSTEEYKSTEECTMCFCSVMTHQHPSNIICHIILYNNRILN
jgi:hypothetical protein